MSVCVFHEHVCFRSFLPACSCDFSLTRSPTSVVWASLMAPRGRRWPWLPWTTVTSPWQCGLEARSGTTTVPPRAPKQARRSEFPLVRHPSPPLSHFHYLLLSRFSVIHLSYSFFVSASLFVCTSPSLSLSLSVSPYLSLPPSVSPYLSPLSLTLSLLYLSLLLFPFLSLPLPLSPSLSVSVPPHPCVM